MTDLDDWLSSGSRPEADVPICLVGDLAAQYQAKAEELVRATADENRSIDDQTIMTLGAELDALQEQMQAKTRTFHLRALPVDGTDEDPSYLDLQLRHPPRPGNEVDARVGGNRETFLPALVKASTVEPELTDGQWATLRGQLSARQWDELWVTAQQLNRGEVLPPKSLGISELMPTSGVKSKKRNGSGSPTSGSKGGRRARSTSTTTKGA